MTHAAHRFVPLVQVQAKGGGVEAAGRECTRKRVRAGSSSRVMSPSGTQNQITVPDLNVAVRSVVDVLGADLVS